MGCAASQHKHSQIVALKKTPGQVLTSSGLQTNPDDLGNGNYPLGSEGNEKEKTNSLGPSLSSCQDLNQDIQTLEALPSKEDLTSVKLPPKDVFPENFSFFRVPEIITQKVKIESAKPSEQPSSENLSESKVISEGKGLSSVNLLKRPRKSIEQRAQGLHPPILLDISNNTSLRNSNATDGKSKESEGVLSTQKVTPDFVGATFSFMNIRPENHHQPFVFFTEENRSGHNYSAKFLQNSIYNRSIQKNQEGNHESLDKRLGVLSEGSAVSSCESFSIENQESHESKPNEFKKVMRFRRTRGEHHEKRISTQNIQTVVNGPPVFGQGGGSISTNIGSVQTVVSINNISNEENKKPITTTKIASHKFTRNLVELIRSPKSNQTEPKKTGFSRTERLKQRIEEKNFGLKSARETTGLQVKNSERANTKPHILNLSPGDDEFDEDSDVQIETLIPEKKPLEFKNLVLQEDGYETSPNAQSSFQNLRTPKTQFTSVSNSPINQVDGSTFLDRTIYNIQDNITQMDLDKYSLYEVLGNIELDDQKSESGGLQGNNRILDDKVLDTSFNNCYFSQNMKSTAHDEVSALPALVCTRPRPKSVTGISQCKGGSTPNSEKNGGQDYTPKRTHRKLSDFSKTSTSVIETKQVDKSVDDEGQKKINQYIMVKKLGAGSFGKVKLAINCDTKEKFAIKIANKHQLKRKMLSRSKSAYTQLATEVAIMKKMDHPNIVRLFEVMDDPNNENLYIVMEFVKKGPVLSRNYWRSELSESNKFGNPLRNVKDIPTNRLTEEKAKKYFRHLVLALDYLHNQMGIIHRDIKPENLLIAEDDTLKVSDFGISKIMEGEDDLLDNNAGTKLFLAPETWKGKSFHGKPADIWAAGGTLYYFLTGKSPFSGLAIDDVKRKIIEDEVKFPSDLNIDPKIKELVMACLKKDPQDRITLEEIMQNGWLTDNGENPLVNHNDDVIVNEEDVSKALTKISFMARVRLTAKIKQRARANAERRKSQEIQKVPSFISQKKG